MQRIPKASIFQIHETLEKQFFLVVQAFEEVNVPMKYVKKRENTIVYLLTSLVIVIYNGYQDKCES
jgi:hypothetical protein